VDKCNVMSLQRRYGILVTYKTVHVERLIRAQSRMVEFIQYKKVNNRQRYNTIEVASYMSELSKEGLVEAVERTLGVRVLDGHFDYMKEGIAYLDFQERDIDYKVEETLYSRAMVKRGTTVGWR
jgi:hypothetical protein